MSEVCNHTHAYSDKSNSTSAG